jgi:hypothetical protein
MLCELTALDILYSTLCAFGNTFRRDQDLKRDESPHFKHIETLKIASPPGKCTQLRSFQVVVHLI